MSNTNQPNPKAPTHTAYQVREISKDKSSWTKIGSAWPNRDGQGYNIQLDAVPLDGRVTLRVVSDKKKDD